MEFIEAKMNPNSTLKMLSKRSRKGPPKNDGKTHIKSRKSRNRHTRAAPAWHGQAMPIFWPAGRVGSWVHGPCARLPARFLPRFARVVHRFTLIGARGFLDPLIFLELTF